FSVMVLTDASQPDFDLVVRPDSRILGAVEASTDFNIFITPLNGFSGDVMLSVSGATSDLSVGSPVPAVVHPTTDGNSLFRVFEIHVPAETETIPLTVTATSGSLVRMKTVNVILQGAPRSARIPQLRFSSRPK